MTFWKLASPALFLLLGSVLILGGGCSSPEQSSQSKSVPPIVQLEVTVDGQPGGLLSIAESDFGRPLQAILTAQNLPDWEQLHRLEVLGSGKRRLTLTKVARERNQEDLQVVRWEGTPALALFRAAPKSNSPGLEPPSSKRPSQIVLNPQMLALWTSPPTTVKVASTRPLQVRVNGTKAPGIKGAELESTPRTKEPGKPQREGGWTLSQLLSLRSHGAELLWVELQDESGTALRLTPEELKGDVLHLIRPNKRGSWTYKSYAAQAPRGGRVEPIRRVQAVELLHIHSVGARNP